MSKHLLDSLSISVFLIGSKILDVGTGAGFPGIPLAIMNPDKKFTLLDSSQKRVAFLNEAKRKLGLTNVASIHSRVEVFSSEKFSSICSRAFSSLSQMLLKTDHLIDHGGVWLAMKGIYPSAEIDQIPSGYCVKSCTSLIIPKLLAERHLLILEKKD